MAFQASQSTLESLEWGRVIDELRGACRTPQGRLRLDETGGDDGGLFESNEAGVRARLRETSEARQLLDRDERPPLGGCADLRSPLAHAIRGGVLEPTQLLDVRATLAALHATRRFFEGRAEIAPTLAAGGLGLAELDPLEQAILRCIDSGGEVRDAASPTLARARREAQGLAGELQARIERSLKHADVAPHLSDRFYTVRNGRFVLPVKADAKGQVRGIVHDASRSGTTLYVEPDAMVELNNRHRQAELTVERETLRVLRELSAAVAREAGALLESLEILGSLDLALARGELSRRLDAVEPAVGHEGIFELPGLRHPLIPPAECVGNDLRVGRDFGVLILSGPNAGGKTVALKAIALAALFVRAGLHVPADPGARVDLASAVLADIGDHQDLRESLSTFSAAMTGLASILRTAGPDMLVCLDEVGVGTDPSEGAAIAQATLEALAESGARVVTTTHYNLLKELAEVDPRFENASVEIDPTTLAPTYHIRIGAPGASSAATVAARMGVPRSVLGRAAALLDREDRQLDRMLSELAASRATLEGEQAAATTARLEAERAREEYRSKLARLQQRRDELFGKLRRELEDSFRTAHGEVARIVAELQRQPESRRAAFAREQLQTLREETDRRQAEAGLVPETPEPAATGAGAGAGTPWRALDWSRTRVGDCVRTPGGGTGTLLTLPDRRGEVFVQVAGAKLRVDRTRIGEGREQGDEDEGETEEARREAAGRRRLQQQATALAQAAADSPEPTGLGGTSEVDLRGLRVDEALDRLENALDLALAQGRDELRVIHGVGTGALCRAVRQRVARARGVAEWLPAAREEGGAGATRVVLEAGPGDDAGGN